MKRQLPSWLMGLFALQIGLAVLLSVEGDHSPSAGKAEPLLVFDEALIDEVRLIEDDKQLLLSHQGNDWQMQLTLSDDQLLDDASTDSDNKDQSKDAAEVIKFPASSGRVESLLSDLQELKASWPVAQTKSAQERFEVSEKQFQRKVELVSGSKTHTLYLGTSPGFRKVHIRLKDSNDIYALNLNLYEMPVDQDHWLDKSLLAVSGITELDTPKLGLVQTHSSDSVKGVQSDNIDSNQSVQWHFKESDETVDHDKASALVQRLQNLNVLAVDDSPLEEALEWHSITAKTDSNQYQWQLGQHEEQYYIQRQDVVGRFTIDQSTYDALVDAESQQLVVASEEPTASKPSEAVVNDSSASEEYSSLKSNTPSVESNIPSTAGGG